VAPPVAHSPPPGSRTEYRQPDARQTLPARCATLLWTDLHGHPAAHGDDYGHAAAAGPGFYVLAGYETTPDHSGDVWVRRYNDG